ncbi:MAG: tol-pal system YbgF family protein, partial [Bdellovibrionales bacterium]
LLKLAGLYSHHSKHADLQIVLNEYIQKLPDSKERPKAHHELINNYELTRNRVAAVEEMKRLSKVCERFQKTTVENDVDCGKLLSGITALLATKWHKMWMKDRSQVVLADSAEQTYDLFLEQHKDQVSDEEKYIKGLYALADLLYQRKKFRQASSKYSLVAELTKVKKAQHDSLYSAIVSIEKAVEGESKKEWSDADEKTFVSYAKKYVSEQTKGPYVQEIRFKRAFIAYEKGRYDEAGTQFKEIALHNSTDEKTLKAQDLYLDILNVKKSFGEIKKYSYEWMKKTTVAARKAKLQKIYHESYFASIQQMEEKGDLAEASQSYKEFAKENVGSNLSDKAMWNAVQLDYKTNRLAQAATDGHRFYKMFPRSEKAKEALIKSAQTFEFLGMIKSAADVLEDLAQVDSASSEKWTALSSDFRYLEGDYARARIGYQKLINSKDQNFSFNAVTKLLAIEKATKNHKAIESMERKVMERRYEPFYGEVITGRLQNAFQAGQYRQVFQEAAEVLSDKRNTPKTLATARYLQAQILEMEFKNQSIVTTPEKLSFLLKIKTEKLEKVLSAYQEVIRYGDPQKSVLAMRELGLCYDHYVKQIRNLRFTKALPKHEMAALQEELEKVIVPMEDKAVETLAQAVQQAKRFNLRDGTIAKIQIDLNAINLGTSVIAPTDIKAPDAVAPYILGGES